MPAHQFSSISRLCCVLIGLLIISGCSVIQPQFPEVSKTAVPSTFSVPGANPELSKPWWLQFKNDELGKLIESGLSHNFSVQATWARLRQAQAAAVKAGASKYPTLTANLGATHSRSENSSGSNTSTDLYSLGLTAAYEVDLWGRVQASRKQQQLSAEISREGLYTAALTLSSQIAKTWVAIVTLQEQQKLVKEQLAIQQKLLGLLEHRLSLARVSLLDVYQQNQSVLSLENSLIPLEAREKLLYHQLAVLLGRSPGTLERIQTRLLPELTSPARAGVPADLLERRPDVRTSKLQLESAAWQVVQKKAERLPRLDLSLSLTMSAAEIGELIDNWILRLGATLLAPLFDGGTRKMEVKRTQAVVDERLAGLRHQLLVAVGEVEDALVEEDRYHRSEAGLSGQITLSDKTLQEATYRYLNGISDFLPVLREQLQSVNLKMERIKTRSEMINARIDLYKALGGSWIPESVRASRQEQPPQS